MCVYVRWKRVHTHAEMHKNTYKDVLYMRQTKIDSVAA